MSDAAKRKAKQKWAIEKPKLDNARQLWRKFFSEPDDEDFKHTMKNARGKLEVPMPAAMPCKTPVNCRGETCSSIAKHRTKCACIFDADESMRIRLEGVPQRYQRSHHCKTSEFIESLQSRAQIHSAASAAVEKSWENLKKIPAWQLTKVRNKKEVIDEARNKGTKLHFASFMDLCHLKNSELEPRFQSTRAESCSEMTLKKMIQDPRSVFTEQGSSASQITAAKSWTLYQDYWDVQDKQQMQYPLLPRSKWKTHRRH